MYDFKTFFWDLEWKAFFTNSIEQLHIKVTETPDVGKINNYTFKADLQSMALQNAFASHSVSGAHYMDAYPKLL